LFQPPLIALTQSTIVTVWTIRPRGGVAVIVLSWLPIPPFTIPAAIANSYIM